MKNAMQLKALVRNKAAIWGISAQMVLQNLMLERISRTTCVPMELLNGAIGMQ